MSDVTRIIRAVVEGRADATHDLLPLVYGELRQIAARNLSIEMPGHTLQPTALVHEAYIRLVGEYHNSWENRAHFFAAAAEAMRRILIDHARKKHRHKRGGNAKQVEFPNFEAIAVERPSELLALDEALSTLELLDKTKADLVKLKFFGGLTTHEAGELLGLTTRTAERYWAFSRVWLYRHVKEESDSIV